MSDADGRSGWQGVGALAGMLALVAAVTVGALAFGSSSPAAAAGLERFSSCAELEDWTDDTQSDVDDVLLQDTAVAEEAGRTAASDGDDSGSSAGAATANAGVDAATPAVPPGPATTVAQSGEQLSVDETSDTAESGSGAGLESTGGTNTVVEGVDEIDVIDRLSDDRLLVSRNGSLAIVDLVGRTVVAELAGVPFDARVSVDGALVWVAGSANDGSGIAVRRVRIDGDSFVEDGTWSAPGYLLDARRTGDRLHVVAVDQPMPGAIPFAEGPVPCDEVWRPVAPATTPAATLVATLPAEGELAPTAVAEVTGAAGNLLVTDSSVYVATETWEDDGDVTTAVHRLDIASLEPTGSGAVPGSIGGPFALSEHEGNLRVATSAGGGFGIGRPIPVDGDVIVDDADTTVDVPAPPPGSGTASLAEVFVLDTDGDLDVIGRTGRFGHDGETIHGVRFVGDIAYVVTFLQTDPFWVVDLSDPAAPAVVGELEIPGFSGYLHPLGDGRVVGFGPDGEGGMAARLFDVSDPAAPAILDEIRLGDDTPVAYDHHAFVGLDDGRFAVPVTEYPEYVEGPECTGRGGGAEPAPLPIEPGIGDDTPSTTVVDGGDVDGGGGGVDAVPPSDLPGIVPCQVTPVGGETGAVVLELVDGRLAEADRATIESAELFAERVVLAPDGTWLVLSWDRLVATDDGSVIQLPTP